MKIIRCLIVLASVLLFCPALSRAQEQGPSSQSAEDSPTRIETKFDTAKNETTVGFKTLLVIDTKTEKLLVSAEATYATQAPKQHPEDVIFIISALNYAAYRYPDINKLTITCDGKRLPEVVLLNLDKRSGGDYFVETLGTRLNYDVYLKMAKAKSVQLQFSETSFALSDEHLAMLGKLADLLHL
jgi:hypothetical protein